MKGLRMDSESAILGAEFFEDSELALHQRGGQSRMVYGALKERDFLRKKLRFNRGEKLMGELSSILIDKNLNPFIKYYPVSWIAGKKQYGLANELPLGIYAKSQWFEFVLDLDARKMYGGFCLYLPERFSLEEQSTL